MRADEFKAFSDYFIVDYANEIAANFGHTVEESRLIASRELAEDLPQTVDTPDHYLLCIEQNESVTIGYLWYKLFDTGKTAFILDFVIAEEFRGQGYGKAALTALETQLAESGTRQINLRVAYTNEKAKRLYETIGFNITGFNMSKSLGRQDE